MQARIGVADSGKVIEIDIDDPDAFRASVEEALASAEKVMWFTDAKKRTVGVPPHRVAYVEVDSEESARTVGFTP
ncbi:hypothetical protein BH23ACT5_BH23ACT5_07350 [soil metagenome]